MIQINNTNTPQTLNLKLEDSVEISTELVKNGSFNEIDLTELVQNGSFSQLGTDLIGNGEFDELGTDVITNGGFTGVTELVDNNDFSGTGGWSTNTGWTVGGEVATCDGTQSGNTYLTSTSPDAVVGKTYSIIVVVDSISAGWITTKVGGVNSGEYISVAGTYTYNITATSATDIIRLQGNLDCIGIVSSVSVKEVGEDWTNGIGWSFGDSKAISTQALGSEEVTNGNFTGVTNIVLDGDFPLPNVNWIIAATTTINGGSATFEGLGTVSDADVLAAAFVVRVEADGGVVEAESCLISDLTFLTVNP